LIEIDMTSLSPLTFPIVMEQGTQESRTK